MTNHVDALYEPSKRSDVWVKNGHDRWDLDGTNRSVSCSSCVGHRQEILSRLGLMKPLARQIGGLVQLELWSRVS